MEPRGRWILLVAKTWTDVGSSARYRNRTKERPDIGKLQAVAGVIPRILGPHAHVVVSVAEAISGPVVQFLIQGLCCASHNNVLALMLVHVRQSHFPELPLLLAFTAQSR